MDKSIDPNWTIQNDLQSVHVGINTRFWIAKKKNEIPVRILLGREHTRLFMKEKGWSYIPKGTHVYGSKGHEVPIVFNAPGIHGIAVETILKPQKPGKRSTRRQDREGTKSKRADNSDGTSLQT